MKNKLILIIALILFANCTALFGQLPEMALMPHKTHSLGNGTFAIKLQLLSNIYDLKSYSVTIQFDSTMIETHPDSISEGPLLGSTAAPTFFWAGFSPDSGTVYIDGAILGDGITTGDVGVLATMRFNFKDPVVHGESPVKFISVRARNANNVPLYYDTLNARVIICEYFLADANGDGTINVSDAVYIINYIFIGGPAPDPLLVGDANCDDTVNVSDAVYIINYIFIGGDPPCRVCY
jgi:hypothetical protein